MTPMTPGQWASVPTSNDSYFVFMALDQYRYVIVTADTEVPQAGDRGEYLGKRVRPDGLLEYIYGPGQHLATMISAVQK